MGRFSGSSDICKLGLGFAKARAAGQGNTANHPDQCGATTRVIVDHRPWPDPGQRRGTEPREPSRLQVVGRPGRAGHGLGRAHLTDRLAGDSAPPAPAAAAARRRWDGGAVLVTVAACGPDFQVEWPRQPTAKFKFAAAPARLAGPGLRSSDAAAAVGARVGPPPPPQQSPAGGQITVRRPAARFKLLTDYHDST